MVSGAAFLARYLDGVRTEHTYSNDEITKLYGLMMENLILNALTFSVRRFDNNSRMIYDVPNAETWLLTSHRTIVPTPDTG